MDKKIVDQYPQDGPITPKFFGFFAVPTWRYSEDGDDSYYSDAPDVDITTPDDSDDDSSDDANDNAAGYVLVATYRLDDSDDSSQQVAEVIDKNPTVKGQTISLPSDSELEETEANSNDVTQVISDHQENGALLIKSTLTN